MKLASLLAEPGWVTTKARTISLQVLIVGTSEIFTFSFSLRLTVNTINKRGGRLDEGASKQSFKI